MKHSVTVGAHLLWAGCYGCNNGHYGCTIVMSYIVINKAVSQWLLTFNLCVSVTWPLTCAFHIPCTHTPEIIDMHRGGCDKVTILIPLSLAAESLGWFWIRHNKLNRKDEILFNILRQQVLIQGTQISFQIRYFKTYINGETNDLFETL